MPLFVCDSCGAVENTATGRYWARSISKDRPGQALCSECHTGVWHGKFQRVIATEEVVKEWGADRFVHLGKLRPPAG